jgi:hypothetical protein
LSLQVLARLRQGGRQVFGIAPQGLGQLRIGLLGLAHAAQDLGAQGRRRALAGHLAFDGVDGIEGAARVALAHEGVDQGQIGHRALEAVGELAQLAHAALLVLAARQLAERHQGAAAHVARVLCRSELELLVGLARLAQAQVGLTGNGMDPRRALRGLEQRLQGLQRARRVVQPQIGLRQQQARARCIAGQADGPHQMGFGLRVLLAQEFELTGQQRDAPLVGCRLQQGLDQLVGGIQPAALHFQHHVIEAQAGLIADVAARHLDALLGGLELARAQQVGDQRQLRIDRLRPQLGGFLVGLAGRHGVLAVQRFQVTLEPPGGIVGVAREQRVDAPQCAIRIARAGLVAGQRHLGADMPGNGDQGLLERAARFIAAVELQQGLGHVHQHVGASLRVFQAGTQVAVDQRAPLAPLRQRPGVQRREPRRCHAGLRGLVELHERAARIAAFQQHLAEQQARLGRLGVLLQGVLQMDLCRLRVLGSQRLLGLGDEFGRGVRSATRQCPGQAQGGRGGSKSMQSQWTTSRFGRRGSRAT